MKKPGLILLLLLIFVGKSHGQFTDRFWTFGDSAAIDFKNLTNPIPSSSILRVRGTCVSICDSMGDLLFYGGSPNLDIWLPPGPPYTYDQGFLINKNHQKLQNGDSLKTTLWYQEMIIVPNPGNINQFYVFTAGEGGPTVGLYYNLVDLSYNGGLGKVIQKNIFLQNFQVSDGLAAIKHGNGRDWWFICTKWSNSTPSNDFYTYLINPSGLSGPIIQSIGTPTMASFQKNKFTRSGEKLFSVTQDNLIEKFDFDRCTGILSNFQQFSPLSTSSNIKFYWSFAISPDESKLYVTSIQQGNNQDTSFLLQFDLNASNFLSSADTLLTLVNPNIIGLLQIGSDNKIYLSSIWNGFDCEFDYLYCDTTWNTVNSNISVINFPDSLGAACDFQPFSFNLGGHRTYVGLPNNPYYELGPLIGSPCDTLSVGLGEITTYKNNIVVYYDQPWNTAFINARGLRGKNYNFQILNLNGQILMSERGILDSEYFTYNAIMSSFADGMYIVRISTEKEILTTKFVKQ